MDLLISVEIMPLPYMEVSSAALDRQEGVVDYEVESICSELENTELTEEETTSLLNDALELNKRLKAKLRRQEEERHRSDGMRSQLGNGNNRSIGVSKRGDTLSASLPPIHPKRGLSLNQRQIRNSVEAEGHSKKTNAKNASVMQRKIQSAEIQVCACVVLLKMSSVLRYFQFSFSLEYHNLQFIVVFLF